MKVADLTVLYEDNHLLGVVKPSGILVQGDRTGDVTLLDVAKRYLKEKYNKPGNVFLGLVHRLDRPVSGVVLFAWTSKAASRLATQFRRREVEKGYLAVVVGNVKRDRATLDAHVERVRMRSRMAPAGGERAKRAVLTYKVLSRRRGNTLLHVLPTTGRHHQIRLQLSHAQHPVVGDIKYRAPAPLPDHSIALHAERLVLQHPTRDERVVLTGPPPRVIPWTDFSGVIDARFDGGA